MAAADTLDAATMLLLAAAFGAGLVFGILVMRIWRGSGERFAQRLLREADAVRQADIEAMLDGVKLAFSDISLESFRRLAEQLQARTQAELASERRLQSHEMRSERAELDSRMRTVLDQLERMRALVLELERDREGKLKSLETELRHAGERATRLVETTRKLADTLANTRVRGQWGERLAEDVLRAAGLQEGISYRRQQTTPGGGRPDFTFILPGGELLHMDVKFPFENYRRSVLADDAEARSRYESAFIRDVRAQVGEVVERGYIAPQTGTLDLALLFIPNEQVFETIARLAPELIDEAIRRGVVPLSPVTLLPVLAILRRAAACFRLTTLATELGRSLGELQNAWAAWSLESETTAKRLDEAAASFRSLTTTRRVRLDRSMARLQALTSPSGDEAGSEPK
jgi:DNA recombination protein RmuC